MSQIELRPGLADVPAAESAVSYIDGKRARLEYRGIAVETLARESCFEETCWLLLKGDLPTQKQLADFRRENSAKEVILRQQRTDRETRAVLKVLEGGKRAATVSDAPSSANEPAQSAVLPAPPEKKPEKLLVFKRIRT